MGMYASGSMGRFKANLGVGDVMKVQTNQGECELTAEMVCRGMVFQDPKIGPTAEQWERLRAAFPAHFSAGRSVGDPHPISGSLADERRLHDCPRCASGPRRTYCSVACGDAEQAARRATDRRQREAPLVALVNACPEGLDPVGWRAGVLAYAEMFRSDADFHWFRKSDMPHVLAVIRDGEKSTGMNIRVFVDAYQRALAPRAKVAPERKGMTWKTRGPALPVDDGRDD